MAAFAPMPIASDSTAIAVKAGMPAQRAQPVSDVVHEVLDARSAEHVPRPFTHLFDTTESDQRLPPRFVRRHAGAPVLLGLLLDVEADLVIEPVLEFLTVRLRQGSGETPPHMRERTHQTLSRIPTPNYQFPIPKKMLGVGGWKLGVDKVLHAFSVHVVASRTRLIARDTRRHCASDSFR